MATHSSVLAWRIPGTGEPGGLPSLGSHRVGHDGSDSSSSSSSGTSEEFAEGLWNKLSPAHLLIFSSSSWLDCPSLEIFPQRKVSTQELGIEEI